MKNRIIRPVGLCAGLCFSSMTLVNAQSTVTYYNQTFKIDTLYPATGSTGMSSPWEIVYGPDDSLWVTASHDYKIWKIHPGNKGARVILDLNSQKDFTAATASPWPQGGLMGLAIHPQFLTGKPWVYVAYVYHLIGCSTCAGSTSGARCSYNTQIVRYSYSNGKLTVMDTVVTALDGSNDHNSGRLRISPVPESDGKYHLYYTIGDMGAGQLANICRAEFAQDTTVIEGKTLRFNTEPDLTQPAGQQWIPSDNPFPSSPGASTRSPIYTFGHRNPQGLAFGSVDGGSSYILYSCEHGDKSDDEINILTPHYNYGWPKISGLCDDNYTSVAGDSLYLAGKAVVSETGFCDTTKTTVSDPIFSYYNWTRAQNDMIAKTYPTSNMNWPTVAPTSLAFYQGAIPGWNYSLLVTSLKNGLWRLQLKSDGLSVDSTVNPYDTLHYLAGYRLRNITVSPLGDTLFVGVDNSCCTLGPTGTIGKSVATPAPGFILRLVYLQTLALDTIDKSPPPPAAAAAPPPAATIYPNPAHGQLFISLAPGQPKPVTEELYTVTGTPIRSIATWQDRSSLPLRGCEPGIYILRIVNGGNAPVVTQKVVID